MEELSIKMIDKDGDCEVVLKGKEEILSYMISTAMLENDKFAKVVVMGVMIWQGEKEKDNFNKISLN